MSFAALIIGTVFGILGGVGVLGWVLWFKQGSNAELGPVVDALRDDVEQLADTQEHTRAQLAEMQERLDFAERLLAAGREDKRG